MHNCTHTRAGKHIHTYLNTHEHALAITPNFSHTHTQTVLYMQRAEPHKLHKAVFMFVPIH